MKKRTKKLLALLLGSVMSLSLLAGCGSDGTAQNTAVESSEASESAESAQAAGDAAGEEASAIDTSEYVELKMYLVGDKPEGFDDVYEKVNEILLEKLNCSISVDWLSWAEHGTKYSLLFSSGEDFDLIYTASSWCHLEQTVTLGGFMELEESFIQTYAPDVWAMMPEVAWKQATIDGSIWVVPANYVEVTPDCVAIRGDWMEELGYEDITTFDELTSFYRDLAATGRYGAQEGNLYWQWFQSMGYAVVSGAPSDGELFLYNSNDTSDLEVKYILDWDEFTEYCHLMKELADAGAWPNDYLGATYDRQDGLVNGRAATMVWNAGSCLTYANQVNAEHPDWNVNIYNIMPDVEFTATKYTNSGLAINVNSKNPERAMMVINEFATNQELQDLTELGIEGVHWNAVGDDQYSKIGSGYTASNCWGWRNMDLMRTEYKEDPTEADLKVDELNAYFLEHVKQEDHILDSFSFDTTNVSTQFAAVEAAMGTYMDPLQGGLVEDVDATLEQFRAALEAAGVRDLLEELQRQIDEAAAN